MSQLALKSSVPDDALEGEFVYTQRVLGLADPAMSSLVIAYSA